VPNDPPLPSPAPEILAYLARHPNARDTEEGILGWWVHEAYIHEWAPKIAETLLLLVERGILEMEKRADGHVFYHLTAQHLATLSPRSSAQKK
jgi:hypothetical protein